MKKIISVIETLPKWCGLCVILVYSLLFAEFFSTVLHLFPYKEALSSIFTVMLSISYATNILLGFILWLIYTLLFHLTALLFGGQATFKRFLFASAYPYLISACAVFIGILLLDGVPLLSLGQPEELLLQDPTFQLSVKLINYSTIPCYLVIVILVRYIHQISYIYAILSVAGPVSAIWLITELVKLI